MNYVKFHKDNVRSCTEGMSFYRICQSRIQPVKRMPSLLSGNLKEIQYVFVDFETAIVFLIFLVEWARREVVGREEEICTEEFRRTTVL